MDIEEEIRDQKLLYLPKELIHLDQLLLKLKTSKTLKEIFYNESTHPENLIVFPIHGELQGYYFFENTSKLDESDYTYDALIESANIIGGHYLNQIDDNEGLLSKLGAPFRVKSSFRKKRFFNSLNFSKNTWHFKASYQVSLSGIDYPLSLIWALRENRIRTTL